MDVQTLSAAAVGSPPVPDASVGFGPTSPSADAGSSRSAAPDTASDIAGASSNVASLPASLAQSSNSAASGKLSHAVAKLFSGGASNVTVTFHVEHSPNEIVTVVKDTQTGTIISQVPSEIMIKMAEFFDQITGVMLDKSA